MYKGNKFKNAVGTHLLKALFFETAVDTERLDVLYSLKLHDNQNVPSLHRLYISDDKITEHEFALTYFDNFAHWKKLCSCNWFKPYLQDMREEKDILQRGAALKNLQEIASDKSNKSNYLANKYIIENGLQIKADERGRPSKEKIKTAAEALFKNSEEVLEDYDRIVSPIAIN